MNSMNLPLVSAIIPTLNEEKNIGRCLESIRKQTYPEERIEVIVVDNDSYDRTKEIARLYTDRVYCLPKLGRKVNSNFRGAQLNFGVRKAKGEIIFFPDADMTFDKDLLFNAVSLITQGNDALYIPERIIGKGFFGQIRDFERSFYDGTCIDAVRIVKKGVYMKVGGFDEDIDFGPDDWDFTKTLRKNKLKIGITKKELFHHEEQYSWRSYVEKKSKYADTFKAYISKWGEDDPDIKKQFGFYYRYFGVFMEKGKWKRIFMHPYLVLGVYLLRISVGLKYSLRKILI